MISFEYLGEFQLLFRGVGRVAEEVADLATSDLGVAVLDEVPFTAGFVVVVRLPSGVDLGFASPFTAENNTFTIINNSSV